MKRDRASCEANHRHFIAHMIQREQVFYLIQDGVAASCESYDFEDTGVVLFFSDEIYAKRVQQHAFQGYDIETLSLSEFLFNWLISLAQNQVAVGTNWTGELAGMEFDPQLLQKEIIAAMGEPMRHRYQLE